MGRRRAASTLFCRLETRWGIIDFFINLLKDPRGFIAGWIIALGPVWVYTPLFLIVFVETGLVFFRFCRATRSCSRPACSPPTAAA